MRKLFSNTKPILLILIFGLLLVQCSKKEDSAETPQKHKATGVIVSVDQKNSYVTIDHEDIPGFMAAMTMPFAVSDSTLLDGLQQGDKVNFMVQATESMYVVSEITKIEQ